ncbi:hypothetical protein NliqN6_5832 [Naganishia liquefaciens]|uniref:Uncharacterized protein n=1 Tax=Naganishia liquefaciens TaxID=104408 RepID=A0A8H3TYY0_9TREE|nr:hypothetical protein NliqN6_5832 [Naganishia liquefaciens]
MSFISPLSARVPTSSRSSGARHVLRHYTEGRRRSFVFDEPRHVRPSTEASNARADSSRFNRNAVPDVYARMVASPIRRCAITGAKLPKDFMIRLRQVSVDVPSPPRATTPVEKQTTRKTYIVPRIIDPVSGVAQSKEQVGKSKYILCRAETFRTLSRKKDRKSLGDVEVPKMLLEQVATQLQMRVIQEMKKLMIQQASEALFEPVKEDGAVQRHASDSVMAILDFRHPTVSEIDASSEATQRTNEPAISMIHPLVSDSLGLAASAYPIYAIPRLFASNDVLTIRKLLGGNSQTASMIALYQPATKRQGADPIPLGIALWRLRLWHGGGWTIPSSGNLQGQEQAHEGRIVQGFKTVQGALHSRWP